MSDWSYVQTDPSEKLVKLHHFAVTKHQDDEEIEFFITVREHATNPGNGMQFIAEADKQINQNTAPITPVGWGGTLAEALRNCIVAIQRFPYEGPMST